MTGCASPLRFSADGRRPAPDGPPGRTGRRNRGWPALAGLLLVLLLAGCSTAGSLPPPADVTPAERAYADELIAAAAEQRLWEARYWHILLHYLPDPLVGVTSEADGDGFFLAAEGRTDPRAELEATITAFFSEEILPPGNQTAQCTFIARYTWLDQQLGFDRSRMPELPCERFEAWRGALDPASVTLIYAAYFFNNPASMFGHTMFRLDKQGRPDDQRLLDYTVTYGAVVPLDDGAVFWALKGMMGGYDGYFTVFPYYIKVREYNDIEDRDLWEYRLTLTSEEIERLMRHLWELGATHFDYFFFKENCSYHLLSLLEAARPSLHLREQFYLWTLPTETLAVVLRQPGLVDTVTYRPSRGSVIEWKLSRMTDAQRALVFDLAEAAARGGPGRDTAAGNGAGNPTGEASADGSAPAEDNVAGTELLDAVAAMPAAEGATVLETAIDMRQREMGGDPDAPRVQRAGLRKLLLARAKLDYREPYPPPPRPAAPKSGPGTSRIVLGGGGDNDARSFYELGIEPVFHELMSREEGYAPNSQILGGALHLRYEPEPERTRLERFEIANVLSLFPLSPLTKEFSWKVRLGWERSRDLGCEYCVPFVLDGGIGVALESRLLTREVYFAFLEPTVQVHGGLFEEGYRLGGGGSLGLLFEITPAYRVALIATQTHYFAGDPDSEGVVESGTVRQRLSLGRHFDLRLDWRAVEDYRETALGLSWFF